MHLYGRDQVPEFLDLSHLYGRDQVPEFLDLSHLYGGGGKSKVPEVLDLSHLYGRDQVPEFLDLSHLYGGGGKSKVPEVLDLSHLYGRDPPFWWHITRFFVGPRWEVRGKLIGAGRAPQKNRSIAGPENEFLRKQVGGGSKPIVPFWGRCTTHFRTYFSGWIGMFTGSTGF